MIAGDLDQYSPGKINLKGFDHMPLRGRLKGYKLDRCWWTGLAEFGKAESRRNVRLRGPCVRIAELQVRNCRLHFVC
jgi:hypothetical protein